jgi:hypothetical protein
MTEIMRRTEETPVETGLNLCSLCLSPPKKMDNPGNNNIVESNDPLQLSQLSQNTHTSYNVLN